MSMMRRRSKSRSRSAQAVHPYVGSTPFEHSPQPFIPPPLAPSTAPHTPTDDSPPASSVGLPLGASSTTPPLDDPFGLGQGVAGLSLGGPRSAAHYSAAGAYPPPIPRARSSSRRARFCVGHTPCARNVPRATV
ncbi:hypothetical protein FS749_007153 [Ceratobasidium sp. UAMH 11750]|nr:hypothetical protein FS749_007153 [Ceratobasidium sp. UAMH 11750]